MKNSIGPQNYIKLVTLSGSGTTEGGSLIIHEDNLGGLSFQNQWNVGGGTLAATVTFEGSNDPRAFPEHDEFANAVWVSFGTPTDVTTGAGGAMDVEEATRFGFVRMTVAYVSGSGTFQSWFSGHGDG